MTDGMLQHLQMLVLSIVFNPSLLALVFVFWLGGRILGIFMPWEQIVKPMVFLFLIGLVLKLTLFRAGYDVYFLFGFPFMAGLWAGSRKNSA